jgi:hypothetical protein
MRFAPQKRVLPDLTIRLEVIALSENEMKAVPNFLTLEESHQVDGALLTSRSKFTVRVSLYALRSLKAIAQIQGCPIADLDKQAIADWIAQDPSLQDSLDHNFLTFFTQLVMSALPHLQKIAGDGPIEAIEFQQVITWFEQQDRDHLGQST